MATAEREDDDTPDVPLCEAEKRSGGVCGQPAGWGTGHLGTGRCKLHGGSTPTHNQAAAKYIAVTLGAPLDIEPHDALMWCVRITAGEVSFFTTMVAGLEVGELFGNPVSTIDRPLKAAGGGELAGLRVVEERTSPLDLNRWIRSRQDAVERLARYSKMALDAGVAERAIEVAEKYGETLAEFIGRVFRRLELTEDQMALAPDIVRSELAALEAGRVVEAAA